MFALGTAIFAAVLGALGYALRRARGQSAPRPFNGNALIAVGGVIIPAAIIISLVVLTALTQRALSAPPTPPALTIDVIGHQFWWEVRYPQHGVTTANEIHLPTGQPVQLRLTSADVIHSFWVPQLAGKLDLNPGQTNTLWIQADRADVYRGICAEFCGIQHTLMLFLVVAEPPDQFAAWLEARRAPPPRPVEPVLQRGQRVFSEAGCAFCHAIEGTVATPPTGTVGPDLTHLGSRRTLAAGIIDNTPENLASWIVRPQEIKPGNRMPNTPLGAEDLQALVAYLESLR